MKQSPVVILCVLAGIAGAADPAAPAPQPVVNPQSGIHNLESVDAVTIPRMLSYQGKLTDTLGVPVPNGNYQLTFRLYTQPSGGSAFWTEAQTILVVNGLFSALLGTLTPVPSVPDAGNLYLSMQVAAGPELSPRLRLVSAAYAYKADSSAWAAAAVPSGAAGGDLTGTYPTPAVDGLQGRAVASTAPATNQVLKWTGSAWAPRNDSVGVSSGGTVTSVSQATGVVCSPNPITTTGTVRFDSTWGDGRFVNEGQAAGGDLAGTYPNPTADGLQGRAVSATAPGSGQVLEWNGSAWAPAADDVGAADNAWVRGTPDSVLFTIRRLGIARGGASNMLHGANRFSHVNFGVACTTGTSGQNREYCAVGGGYANTATNNYATVAGGFSNTASNTYVTVAGGYGNTASGSVATVGGGAENVASNTYATVAGGYGNTASGIYATVAGGDACDVVADYGFAVGNNSDVLSGHNNSAAFNGQITSASGQTRVGALSKASGTFTIDHPLDPNGKILNHYFVESPDMSNVYSGSVVLDAAGRGEVRLPDYFDALNRNPRVQLTGIGTSDVYVAEKPAGNRFVVGGKPGTEVYWQVTGDRKDPSAEITRYIMPVEQPKTGQLAGRSLDDDFLRSTKDQLDRMGVGGQFDFRTAAGRERYLEMRRAAEEDGE